MSDQINHLINLFKCGELSPKLLIKQIDNMLIESPSKEKFIDSDLANNNNMSLDNNNNNNNIINDNNNNNSNIESEESSFTQEIKKFIIEANKHNNNHILLTYPNHPLHDFNLYDDMNENNRISPKCIQTVRNNINYNDNHFQYKPSIKYHEKHKSINLETITQYEKNFIPKIDNNNNHIECNSYKDNHHLKHFGLNNKKGSIIIYKFNENIEEKKPNKIKIKKRVDSFNSPYSPKGIDLDSIKKNQHNTFKDKNTFKNRSNSLFNGNLTNDKGNFKFEKNILQKRIMTSIKSSQIDINPQTTCNSPSNGKPMRDNTSVIINVQNIELKKSQDIETKKKFGIFNDYLKSEGNEKSFYDLKSNGSPTSMSKSLSTLKKNYFKNSIGLTENLDFNTKTNTKVKGLIEENKSIKKHNNIALSSSSSSTINKTVKLHLNKISAYASPFKITKYKKMNSYPIKEVKSKLSDNGSIPELINISKKNEGSIEPEKIKKLELNKVNTWINHPKLNRAKSYSMQQSKPIKYHKININDNPNGYYKKSDYEEEFKGIYSTRTNNDIIYLEQMNNNKQSIIPISNFNCIPTNNKICVNFQKKHSKSNIMNKL